MPEKQIENPSGWGNGLDQETIYRTGKERNRESTPPVFCNRSQGPAERRVVRLKVLQTKDLLTT